MAIFFFLRDRGGEREVEIEWNEGGRDNYKVDEQPKEGQEGRPLVSVTYRLRGMFSHPDYRRRQSSFLLLSPVREPGPPCCPKPSLGVTHGSLAPGVSGSQSRGHCHPSSVAPPPSQTSDYYFAPHKGSRNVFQVEAFSLGAQNASI